MITYHYYLYNYHIHRLCKKTHKNKVMYSITRIMIFIKEVTELAGGTNMPLLVFNKFIKCVLEADGYILLSHVCVLIRRKFVRGAVQILYYYLFTPMSPPHFFSNTLRNT